MAIHGMVNVKKKLDVELIEIRYSNGFFLVLRHRRSAVVCSVTDKSEREITSDI